nr:MAG TPA: hypothetical protein [Caudoviricetes sp.]
MITDTRSFITWLFTVVHTPEGVEACSPEGDTSRGSTINTWFDSKL